MNGKVQREGYTMKKQIALIAMAFGWLAAFAELSVTGVTAQQRYPWNGMVDIDYEVVSDDPDADVWVYAVGFDKDSNQSMGVRTLSGDVHAFVTAVSRLIP